MMPTNTEVHDWSLNSILENQLNVRYCSCRHKNTFKITVIRHFVIWNIVVDYLRKNMISFSCALQRAFLSYVYSFHLFKGYELYTHE